MITGAYRRQSPWPIWRNVPLAWHMKLSGVQRKFSPFSGVMLVMVMVWPGWAVKMGMPTVVTTPLQSGVVVGPMVHVTRHASVLQGCELAPLQGWPPPDGGGLSQ